MLQNGWNYLIRYYHMIVNINVLYHTSACTENENEFDTLLFQKKKAIVNELELQDNVQNNWNKLYDKADKGFL